MSDWLGTPAHMEFGSTDTKATLEFLSKTFGLSFESGPEDSPMEYHTAYTPGQPSTAVRPTMPMEPGPSQTPYFLTADIDKTIVAAQENGATVMLPKTPLPGGKSWMAWFQIPGGNTIAVLQQDA